jgi:GT2 family glycosyltransferase
MSDILPLQRVMSNMSSFAQIRIASALSVLPEWARKLADQIPEVWIYDNGSTPRMSLPQVFFRSEWNRMFVKGWNDAMARMIANARPQAVWMMNDDIEGVSTWMLDRMFSAMAACPDAALITPVFNSPHEIFHAHHQFYGLREVPWVDWCCPLVSAEAWMDVGPFDEDFVGYGADIDWCMRAKAKGWKFYVHEGCTIHHVGSVTTFTLGKGEMSDVGRMATLLEKKWNVSSWWELTR